MGLLAGKSNISASQLVVAGVPYVPVGGSSVTEPPATATSVTEPRATATAATSTAPLIATVVRSRFLILFLV